MTRTTAFAAAAAAAAALAVAPVWAQEDAEATARMIHKVGGEAGEATVTGLEAGGVLLTLEVQGLLAGEWHAVHIHETGECDPETQFKSAGGHFNPTSQEHGWRNLEGAHIGDLPNQHVGEDGVMRAEIYSHAVSLDDGDNAIRGKAIVVHAARDDYETEPAGGAGTRLACGVIE